MAGAGVIKQVQHELHRNRPSPSNHRLICSAAARGATKQFHRQDFYRHN